MVFRRVVAKGSTLSDLHVSAPTSYFADFSELEYAQIGVKFPLPTAPRTLCTHSCCIHMYLGFSLKKKSFLTDFLTCSEQIFISFSIETLQGIVM